MWLVGVVVRRYIDILIKIINFPYSTCIRSFFGSSILTSLFILKMFFRYLRIIESVDFIRKEIIESVDSISMSEVFHCRNTLQTGEYIALGKLSCILNTTIVFYS